MVALSSCEQKEKHHGSITLLNVSLILLGDEEEEGSYDTDEGQDYRAQPPRDVTSSSSLTGPSPSSVVKLEANQKARNKKQRQELYGKTAFRKTNSQTTKLPRKSSREASVLCFTPRLASLGLNLFL